MQPAGASRRGLVAFLALVVLVAPATAGAAPGDLDRTFGGDGKVVTRFHIGAFASDVAIQGNGRIVAGGAAAGASATGAFALARYLPTGALDATFGGDGRVTTAVSAGGDEIQALAIQKDGRIVAAGTNTERFELARYLRGGRLDPSFGQDGVVTTDVTARDDLAYGVAIQPNGKILVGGTTFSAGSHFVLVRYRSNGTLDPTFGEGGIVVSRRGQARALALQPNGRIVLAGFDSVGLAMARYLRDGSLDPSFGHGGRTTAPQGFGGFSVTLQTDGKIVVGGAYDFFQFAVVRFTTRGRLDGRFASGGVAMRDVGGSEQGVASLAIQHDGRILAVGHAGPHETSDPIRWRFVILRYRANGALDRTFGHQGQVNTRFPDGAFANGAAVADRRLIVVGGVGESNAQGFGLARYTA